MNVAQSLILILPFLLPSALEDPTQSQKHIQILTEKWREALSYLHLDDNLLIGACPGNSRWVKTLLLTFLCQHLYKTNGGRRVKFHYGVQILIIYRHPLSQRKDDVYRPDNNIWFPCLPSQTESLLKPNNCTNLGKGEEPYKKEDTFKKSKCVAYMQNLRWSKGLSSLT